MSRTNELVHDQNVVERDAKRFDYLCQITEESSSQVVKTALDREFAETTASGTELLTEEAMRALATLAEEAVIQEQLDQTKVISDLQEV